MARIKTFAHVTSSRVKWLTGNSWLGWSIIFAAFLQFCKYLWIRFIWERITYALFAVCGVGTITGGYIVQEFVRFQDFRAVVIGEKHYAALQSLRPEY